MPSPSCTFAAVQEQNSAFLSFREQPKRGECGCRVADTTKLPMATPPDSLRQIAQEAPSRVCGNPLHLSANTLLIRRQFANPLTDNQRRARLQVAGRASAC